jgi:DAACS family dicarboxylate/amino acid:cation (Na+ or H+) symporter
MSLVLLGLPPEQIGLVIGVDRLLDMFRTTVNVLGDLAIASALKRVGEQPGERWAG